MKSWFQIDAYIAKNALIFQEHFKTKRVTDSAICCEFGKPDMTNHSHRLITPRLWTKLLMAGNLLQETNACRWHGMMAACLSG